MIKTTKAHQRLSQWIAILAISLLSANCSTTYPNRNPVGKTFPSISGKSLEDKTWKIPEGLSGKTTLLLLGYKMDSQFDIDRWLIGLDMKNVPVTAIELPTIRGMFPRMFSTSIDNGMRSGIPKELWGGVITVYADGDRVQKFTGNEFPRNARVLLIDPKGEIIYFHDGGFSVAALNRLIQALH